MPSINLLKQLRKKPFEAASIDEVQAWMIYCSKILPAIVPLWKKRNGLMNNLLSNAVTPTDEAFTLWTLQIRLQSWEKRAMETVPTPRKVGKVLGQKHYSVAEMRAFADIHTEIKAIRASAINTQWEQEFIHMMNVNSQTKNTTVSNQEDVHSIEQSHAREFEIPMDYSDEE
jgi:hypothetical protein